MAENRAGDPGSGEHAQEKVGRRGMLAWAAALAGAGLAWLGSGRRVEASHATGSGGPANSDGIALHVDEVNDGVQRTFLVGDVTGNPPLVSFNGTGPFSIGVSDAIQAITRKVNGAAGLRGRSVSATGTCCGVAGETQPNGTGVVGSSGSFVPSTTPTGIGVYGVSLANAGVGCRGQIPSSSSQPNTIAVYGENSSTNTGGTPGAGGFGCYGFSANGHGLVGATGTAGGGAVIGSTNGVVGAYAGIFFGQFTVVGGPKNAAVAHPDGRHRLLYCMESPEAWFEDFGNAKLEGGCADVRIDPEFAAVADVSDYHVFLTPYGNSKGIHVANRTPTGFTVEEADRGASEIAFAWRVVAKRKDIEAPRLAKVDLPKEPTRPVAAAAPAGAEPQMVPAPRKRKPHAHHHEPVRQNSKGAL